VGPSVWWKKILFTGLLKTVSPFPAQYDPTLACNERWGRRKPCRRLSALYNDSMVYDGADNSVLEGLDRYAARIRRRRRLVIPAEHAMKEDVHHTYTPHTAATAIRRAVDVYSVVEPSTVVRSSFSLDAFTPRRCLVVGRRTTLHTAPCGYHHTCLPLLPTLHTSPRYCTPATRIPHCVPVV